MADENGAGSAGDQNSSGGAGSAASGQGSKQDNNSVSYETYEKLLIQRKQDQEKVRQYEERLRAIEEEKLKAEGNKDKLLERYQKSAAEAEARLKEKTRMYAERALKSQIALKAKELGCRDTDLLYRAMDLEKLRVDLVDDDLNVDEKSLMSQLETLRKEKFYLFDDKAPKFRDGSPDSKSPPSTGKKSLDEMSMEELRKFTRENPDLA